MKSPLKVPSWFRKARQIAEQEWESTYNYDRRAVYLVDPSAVRAIDTRIIEEVWPIIYGFFESSRFRLANGPLPNIEAEWSIYPCRSVSFIFEDPKRPLRRETRPAWYCRGAVRCTLTGDSLSQYCAVSLPYSTDTELIHDLMIETSDGGIPSQLTLSRQPELDDYYDISFEHGAGLLDTPRSLAEKLRQYADFIDSASELEASSNSPILFRRLIRDVQVLHGTEHA